MPASLLESQSPTPRAACRRARLIVSIAMSPRRVSARSSSGSGSRRRAGRLRTPGASADFLEFLKDQLAARAHHHTRMFSGAGSIRWGDLRAHPARHASTSRFDDGNRQAYEAEGLEALHHEPGAGRCGSAPTGKIPERLFDEPDEMLDWARGALAADGARREKKPEGEGKRDRSSRAMGDRIEEKPRAESHRATERQSFAARPE